MGFCGHGGEASDVVPVLGGDRGSIDMAVFRDTVVRWFQLELIQNPFEVLLGMR